jgi:hypothetical protein
MSVFPDDPNYHGTDSNALGNIPSGLADNKKAKKAEPTLTDKQRKIINDFLKESLFEDLKREDIIEDVKNHLSNPLKPALADRFDRIKHIVSNPTINVNEPGGLKPKALIVAKKLGLTDLIRLSEEHQIETRVKVHAVLKTAELLIKRLREFPLKETEKIALKGGISITRKKKGEFGEVKLEEDKILTTLGNATTTTPEFKEMMRNLHRALKISGDKEYHKILETAAGEEKYRINRDHGSVTVMTRKVSHS